MIGEFVGCRIPILGMVDGDPFGLDILSVYKYGSRGMQHENEKLATKRIKWLGVWASELDGCVFLFVSLLGDLNSTFRLGISKDQLLPITRHDEKKVIIMIIFQNLEMSVTNF